MITIGAGIPINLAACGKTDKQTSDEVCKALEEKYGEEFVASKIGDRYNTGGAKLYVSPKDNEDMVFVATIDEETGEVEDGYLTEKVNFEIETTIADCFDDEDVTVVSSCMVVTNDPLEVEVDEYTPKTFSEEYDFDDYTVYLIIEDDNLTAEKICNAMENVYEEIGVKIIVAGYIFESDDFDVCSEQIEEIPDISYTLIEKHSPIAEFNLIVNDDGCSINSDELAEKIGMS